MQVFKSRKIFSTLLILRNSSATETFMDNFRTNDLKEMQIHSSV
jgi:hypothetical protein